MVGAGFVATGKRAVLSVTIRQTSGWKLTRTRWVAEAGDAATPAGAIARLAEAACVGVAAMPSS